MALRLSLLRSLALVALVLPVLAGCGTGGIAEEGSEARGKELFTQKCGSCHVLADANTKGNIGPNLDDAFATARAEDFDVSTIREVVHKQIKYPAPPMPDGDTLFTDEETREDDIAAVATYVANKAGTGAAPSGGTAAGGTDGKSIFASTCGSCHTLADAGTNGAIGPNLDDSKPSVELAVDRVTNGEGAMPSFKSQLSKSQIAAVARYVSRSAGK